jgi:hypothetical protein
MLAHRIRAAARVGGASPSGGGQQSGGIAGMLGGLGGKLSGLSAPLKSILGGKAPGSDIQAPQPSGGSGGGFPIEITNAEKVAQKGLEGVQKGEGEVGKAIGQTGQQLSQTIAQSTQSLIGAITKSQETAANIASGGLTGVKDIFTRWGIILMGIVMLAGAVLYFGRQSAAGPQGA